MKLSKNLLASMTVGLALGATTSCTGLFEEINLNKKIDCTESCTSDCEGKHDDEVFSCPACGMG